MLPAVLAGGDVRDLGNLDDFETSLLIGLRREFTSCDADILTAYVSPSYGLATAIIDLFIVTVVMVGSTTG